MNKLIGHYVYVDVRRNGQVFYVGKGFGKRFYTALRPNKHWMAIAIKEKGYTRRIVKQGLTEFEAFELERKLIKKYGRKQLVNATDGGDGALGIVRTSEHKRKNAEHLIALNKSRTGKKFSAQHKQNISASLKGRAVSELMIQKLIERNKARTGERRTKCVG
jgi:hypothetical protein